MLGTETDTIKFSLDSMIKNRINHPEINFNDYKKITDIISNPDKVAYSKNNNNSIILFKNDDKYYMAVVKATADKKENYLTSFRNLTEKEYNKY
jgi:negative regulator of genetic competence, sporulation and motility